ncbi:MAG: type secretion-associated protein ImpA family [Myxococcales bacterium]|nr:type secretion-associated protein ImpA family [Myxococcales bacterium]
MASVDIAALTAPIPGEDPCGPNLEYDAEFAALERACVGKPEQQIGTTIVKAEDPDWPLVERQARALLGRTKDLHVTVHFTRALIRLRGWEGFAAGLALLATNLADHWDGVHPRLDPDDGNDPTARLNVLAGLADAATLAGVRAMPLVATRSTGAFGLREIDLATGETVAAPDDPAPPSMAVIDGTVNEVDVEALTATATAVTACAAALAAIEATVADKSTQTPSFGRLPLLVRSAERLTASWLAQRQPAQAGLEATAGDTSPTRARGSGEISSREDVIRTLDRVIAYYARHEPSSPIPMLIERSKKLVPMSFVDIIRELAPDGVSQIENLRGRTD